MGLTLFIILALAEIALVVLTFTRFGEKAAWRKNRAAVRLGEMVLLLAMLLIPAVHMKWRFFGVLMVVSVRFIFAGIMWLVKRKKDDGMKKKGWSVVNCVFSIILICTMLTPAFIFTNYNGLPVSGEYEVKEVSAILVDGSRSDPFEGEGTKREVPAHFYYPENAEGTFPLIIFSHGAFGYYQSNTSTFMDLASNGYVVVSLDHPHHSFFTKKTDGSVVTVDSEFIDEAFTVGAGDDISYEEIYEITKDWTSLRADDESFVLDSIKNAKKSGELNDAWHTEDTAIILDVIEMTNTDKIGAFGHSLGGASSVELGRERDDIGAVVDLDGTVLGEVTGVKDGEFVGDTTPYPVPVLVLGHSDDDLTEEMVKNAKDGKFYICEGANHMDFTDLSLLSPFISNMLSGESKVDNEKFLHDVNDTILNWFDYYLKNEGTLKEINI